MDLRKLRREQQALWRDLWGDGPAPCSGGQTPEQAEAARDHTFGYICQLEGIPFSKELSEEVNGPA